MSTTSSTAANESISAIAAKGTRSAKKTVAKKAPRPVAKKAPLKTPAKALKKAPAHTSTLKEVATQSRRKVSTVVHLTRDASFKLIDSQRAIWLAGLGALAKVTTSTGAKGEKAFEALVHAGEKLEAQARGAIDTNADRLKDRIDSATHVVDHGIDTVGDAFDARVKQALARLGYPKDAKAKKKTTGK